MSLAKAESQQRASKNTVTPEMRAYALSVLLKNPAKTFFDGEWMDSWQEFYEAALAEEMAADGHFSSISKRALKWIQETDDCLLEEQIRRAGFRMGFEAARILYGGVR